MSSNTDKPETVSISVKTKWLWFGIGVLLCLLVVSPVVASYMPSSAVSSLPSGAGSGGASTAPNCQNPCTIVIQNSLFGPTQPTVVKAGTTITWVNKDNTDHTVTSNTGLFDSGIIPVGKSFSYT
ncbi:MAG: hypothetical protein ACRDF4_09685, partial [Rhabdochlamydiaceae bacterium]